MVEHWWTVETEQRSKRDRIAGTVKVTFYRYRCSCGHATSWSQDRGKAKRQADRHALNGQLAHTA